MTVILNKVVREGLTETVLFGGKDKKRRGNHVTLSVVGQERKDCFS